MVKRLHFLKLPAPYPHFPFKTMTYPEAFAVDQNWDLIICCTYYCVQDNFNVSTTHTLSKVLNKSGLCRYNDSNTQNSNYRITEWLCLFNHKIKLFFFLHIRCSKNLWLPVTVNSVVLLTTKIPYFTSQV